jgi:uncharacterized protein (TIGR02996 family)
VPLIELALHVANLRSGSKRVEERTNPGEPSVWAAASFQSCKDDDPARTVGGQELFVQIETARPQPTLQREHPRLLFGVMFTASSLTGNGLLRAVLCDPDDDAPRLILADWLDENDQSDRATLIRRMVAMPSYIFYWSRRWKRPKHIHAESRRAIRGLLGQVWPMCAMEWEPWPQVEEVVMRRGFVEAITIRSTDFLRLAIEFFPFHPIQDVLMWDLSPEHIPEHRGWLRASLVRSEFGRGRWPVAFFPECSHRRERFYKSPWDAREDLQRHAAAYGRRLAMIRVEPPPVPVRPAEPRAVPFGKVGGEGMAEPSSPRFVDSGGGLHEPQNAV